MDQLEYDFMRRAVEEARKSLPEDRRLHPKVGAVIVKDGKILATAYRGELGGNHAEYFVLEGKLKDDVLAGATVYTTLEPCTTRNHPKVPCARRLIERRVARVVIGMLDPNPEIVGRGQRLLREANIATDFFPPNLMAEIEELNRDFIRSFSDPVRFRRALMPKRMRGLRPNAPYSLRYVAQLARRWWVTWTGASKPDFFVDGLRVLALIVLAWGIFEALGLHPLHFILGKLGIAAAIFDFRLLVVPSALILYLHIFVYTFIRRPTKWDIEYRNRKLNMTAALHNATACVQDSISTNRLRNIERNALSAIKSYLEFTVSDRDGNNFCANLLVKHPGIGGRLACIRRTDAARGGGTVYEELEMRRVRRTMETGETYYDGDYSRDSKPYRMVWHIPVPSTHFQDPKCIGLICIDSRKPRHLNLLDGRRSLLLNLSPYLSLLEYALAVRFEYNIWDTIE
jgi:pyrimidine deaminase RibD-like protein